MKWCALLSGETPGLAQFRAENPEETNWDRFRDDGPRYTELADALTERQRGICAFCEAPLFTKIPTPVRQVDHWIPKSNDGDPAPEISFGFANFHASCLGGTKPHLEPPFGSKGLIKSDNVSCGQKKGDRNPVNIPLPQRPYRPTELPLTPTIFIVAFDGTISVNPAAVDIGLSSERIEATIQYLGLNCERLKLSRAAVRLYLDEALAEYEASAPEPGTVTAMQAAMAELAADLSPKPGDTLNAFISVLRDFFGPNLDHVLLPDPNWAVQ